MQQLIPYLFRTEYSKIVAVICKTYGLAQIELAEDVVSNSFLKATEIWRVNGIPENPKAWLYAVSKNELKDYFKRTDFFRTKVTDYLKNNFSETEEMELDLSEHNIEDSQLQMLFAICNPINNKESQIALALKVLCGFSVEETANALLSSKENINKKLYRAKNKLRENKIEPSIPSFLELENRLNNVLSVLYLLFNEGYYSTHAVSKIRKELCIEAMRLLYLLLENKQTDQPEANALMALFCFHSSRFEARTGQEGEQILMNQQDQSKWDRELIAKGREYLKKSSAGKESKYHIEALISYAHVRQEMNENKKWEAILGFYNRLLQLDYSPMAALNRTYALSRVKGKELAIKEALKINLEKNHLYHSLLANLYNGIDKEKQKEHLKMGITLCKSKVDKDSLMERLTKVG